MTQSPPTDSRRVIRIGTRKSPLALWQSRHVAALIEAAWPDVRCELHHVVTQGDMRIDRPLPEIGGKGLFTAELEEQLRQGQIDLAVHSLKDLPVEDAPGLTVGAIPAREDVRDVLIAPQGMTLATLPAGAVVGTSSLRRQAQILAARPDLVVKPIRGNVGTRLRKVAEGEYNAAVMAAAGLMRLGLTDSIAEWLDEDVMLPAPGQGALGIQCRADDPAILELLAPLDDAAARLTAQCERQLLWALGGGCSAPIGAAAYWDAETETLRLAVRVATVDGRHVFAVDVSTTGQDIASVVAQAVDQLLADGTQRALVRPADSGPLAGKRVVVTRAADQARELGDLLAAAGAQPIFLPLIRIEPIIDQAAEQTAVADALADLAQFDWLVFTSTNAVDIFLRQCHQLGRPLSATIDNLPRIAAVGPATRDALIKHGLPVDAMPDEYVGAAIPDALGDLKGMSILLPRSARGGAALPKRLVALGARVVDLPIYTTISTQPSAKAQQGLAGGVDAITFASGSAVQAWLEAVAVNPALGRDAEGAAIVCIGPSTAQVAQEAGLRVDVAAPEHTLAGMVDALAAYYEEIGNQQESRERA